VSRVLITAVVASYNEERHIGECIRGLLRQRDIDGEIEIIVVDGGSRDRTVEIVRGFPEFGDRIRLFENPGRLQVYAWNIGIREAKGKFVTLISAHTEYSETYLRSCLEAQRRTGAANVGGVQVAVGDGAVGNVIAWAMQSPFGIGNGSFRYGRKAAYVDHVFTFFAEKATLDSIGEFDEAFAVNEDCEFNYRVRKAGYRIYCSPDIRVRYHARASIPALARQMYRYGFWRRRTQLVHPEYVPRRVYGPPLLVAGLIGSALLLVAHQAWLAAIIPSAYAAFLAVGAVSGLVKTRSLVALALAPVVLCAMHLSYGIGWWRGFFTHRKSRIATAPALASRGSKGPIGVPFGT